MVLGDLMKYGFEEECHTQIDAESASTVLSGKTTKERQESK